MTVHWSLFIGMERGGETGEKGEVFEHYTVLRKMRPIPELNHVVINSITKPFLEPITVPNHYEKRQT
jgi:hypothetical protein